MSQPIPTDAPPYRTTWPMSLISSSNVTLALFPELGISAYSNEDLFHQDALLKACLSALHELVEESKSLESILVVGAPLQFDAKLFNCAVVIYQGSGRLTLFVFNGGIYSVS